MAAPPKKPTLPRRLLLMFLAYVLCVNFAVRRFGADSNPLSVVRLPEKTYALFILGLHSVKHLWSDACDDPRPYVVRAARAEGVPVRFALAIARAESGFRSHSISSTGAMGIMQLMPRTARAQGVIDPFDPEDNARGAARYLRELWRQYRGNQLRVAAAYNAGSGRVPRHGRMRVPASTRGYAARVVRHARHPIGRALDEPLAAVAP